MVSGRASTSISKAHRRFGRPARSRIAGCSSPAWPTVTPSMITAAQRPGCQGRSPQLPARSGHSLLRRRYGRLRKRPGSRRCGPAPRSGRITQTGQHTGHVQRLTGSDASRAAISASSTLGHVESVDRSDVVPGDDDLPDSEECQITLSAGDVAGGHFQQARQQRGVEFRTVSLERIEHLDGAATLGVGARPHWSNTPAGMNGYGSTSVKPSTASTRPMLRRRRWAAVSPVPAGCPRRTGRISSRPSRRSTSSTRSARSRRSGRHDAG